MTDDGELALLMANALALGITPQKNRYALIGGKSITLVPNTASCVADVVIIDPSLPGQRQYYWHARTRKIYTFLNNEKLNIEIGCVDLRPGSPTFGSQEVIRFAIDPRFSIKIEPGIAYSISCPRRTLLRCEHEIFSDRDDPRTDIPMFGNDIIPYVEGDPILGVQLPDLRCPDELVYKIAKYEQEQIDYI